MSRTILKKVARPVLGEEIRGIRGSLGLIQEEFAQRLEVAHSTVRNWESGRTRPGRRMLARIRALAPAAPEKKKSRRYSDETISAAHSALDLVLDHARSDVVEKVLADLQKFAGRLARDS